MKFGKKLDLNAKPEWRTQYIDYKALKELIKQSVEESRNAGVLSYSPRTTSLTVIRANKNASAADKFFTLLESEVAKVGKFTQRKVDELRSTLKQLQYKADKATEQTVKDQLSEEATAVGDNFLALEKYVNLNYLGFHKIIKKHDKRLPNEPCRPFYVSHLHQQPWVQGTYSDLLVSLSNIHSMLRGDTSGERNDDSAQVLCIRLTPLPAASSCAEAQHHKGAGGPSQQRYEQAPHTPGVWQTDDEH